MHRYDYLGSAAIVTGDVSWEGVDVVDDLRFVVIDSCPADAEVSLENEAGYRTLVGVDHQIPILEEIETGPGNAGDLVMEEGGGGRAMSDGIVGLCDQLFELLHDPLITVNALLLGHDDVLEFGIRNSEFGMPPAPYVQRRRGEKVKRRSRTPP
jgi:hypothetical protein